MKLIDYILDSTTVANPDSSMPASVVNCSIVAGPGNISSGNFPKALDLGANGRLQSTLVTPAQILTSKFCLRVVFKISSPVIARQNLIESNCLPFSMFIDKASGSNDFKLAVSVAPKAHGWSGTTTEFFKDLKQNTWYTADLVYDTDTVAVFVDGIILSVHAFPNGNIEKSAGNKLFIGTWVDGARNHFNGQMAAVQWYNDEIPAELEAQLDERRSHPEWFLSYKQEQIKPSLNFGNLQGKYSYDYAATAYVQLFDAGLIMYNETAGTAFEMHGAIFQYYKSTANKSELGYLVTDESNTTKAGGKKSLFSKGGIYWSPATGALAVSGKIYLEYEHLGESSLLGWPISAATAINNGKEQIFQGGRMYYKNSSTKAFEVHGAILTKFLSSGGVNAWGYPVSNESDVRNGATLLGKSSDFEACTIYWSGSTGAFEVHGDIREKYKSLNGPIGQMGFPTSDEGNIPGASGAAKFNTFQNGSILWFGSSTNMYVCQAFKVWLGRVDSKESEGLFMGQNDLYLKAILRDNGSEIHSQRIPNSGDSNGHNVYDFNTTIGATIIPNSPNRNINVCFDIWESDDGAPFGGGDDHLGTYNKTLNMANAWGMKENNGVFNSGAFQMINCITWSVKPQVNENLLSETQKWWGVKNKGTNTLSYNQYAAAFRDVDSEAEWWDLTDWLEKAFYELVIKGLAAGGNCFGMSLEAIYAYKHRSLFSLPLDRFTDWNTVGNEFNIKHQYQVGAEAIWWFVGQFLSGNTHDPKDVFNETRNEFNRGCNPVVCIAQNWDFSGKPHCILPIAWDSSSSPWKMTILDPNFTGQTRTLFVDPVKNEFSYDGGNKYSGGEWSGGRFHYMPFSITGSRPRTPIWDAIALLLAGTIIILGADTETVGLVDANGNDLDAFGTDSINRLKQGKSLDNKFVSVKGFDAKASATSIRPNIINMAASLIKPKGILASEMYMRTSKSNSRFEAIPGIRDLNVLANLTVGDIMSDKATSTRLSGLVNNEKLYSSLRDRSLTHVLNDPQMMKKLDPSIANILGSLTTSGSISRNFKHQLRGKNNGDFIYAIKDKLNEFKLQSGIKSGELSSVETKDLGTSSSIVKMITNENKTVRLEINNKLGIGKDNINIVIDKIPASVGKELSLNIKPGMAGLDILTTAEKVNASVSIKGQIDGKKYQRAFGVDIEGGLRIRPSTVINNNELKIGKIDNLFGQMREGKIIKGS
jgi:hypothetical protein